MTSISASVLSEKVNDGLKRRAVGRHNQTDVYLAIVKRSGNENATPASQACVCKNQERRVSFECLTSQASRDIGDGCMRVPEWDNLIRDVPVSSQRVRAGAECEESRMRGGKSRSSFGARMKGAQLPYKPWYTEILSKGRMFGFG